MSFILLLLVCTCLEVVMANNQLTLAVGAEFKKDHQSLLYQRIVEFNPNGLIFLGEYYYIDYVPFMISELSATEIILIKEKTILNRYYVYMLYHLFLIQYQNYPCQVMEAVYQPLKQNYLDQNNEPKDSPLRVSDSIYQSFYLDSHQKIQVILTDVMYERFEDTGDTLGDQQWAWLEQQLQKQAELTILCSGVPVMPDDRKISQSWFLESQQRLYELIQKYHSTSNSRLQLVIFMSSQSLYSEILQHPCPQRFGQDIFEFTSSGRNLPNDDALEFLYLIYDFKSPATFNPQKKYYYLSNFGILKIDVSETGSPLKVIYECHSSNDTSVQLRQEIQISQIKYNSNRVNQELQCILDIPAKQRYDDNQVIAIKNNWLFITQIVSIFIFLISNIIIMIKERLETQVDY